LVENSARGRERKLSLSAEVVSLLEGLVSSSTPAEQHHFASAITEDKDALLQALAQEVSECRKCGLCETRTQTVFGVGNPNADLVFVGEAPGFYEDKQGIPFVGEAGKLLTDMIEKGMQLPRDSVYICNVIKCRPPDNRNPNPEEVQSCEPYLLRQLEIIQPKVICALGKYAAQTLLGSHETIGKMRGKWHDYNGTPLRATYHPSYLLRQPADKKKAWADLKEIMHHLGLPVKP
jgi:DNA polymerase